MFPEEDALRRTVSLLKATLDSTADGILVVDRDGNIVRYNRQFQELWKLPDPVLEEGVDAAALAWALDHVVDPDRFIAGVRWLYDRPEATSHDEVLLRDGRVLERYSCPQRLDGRVVGRVWSFRDVTTQRRAQTELGASERHFRSLIENAQDTITILDAEGRITFESPSVQRVLGWRPEELIGTSVFDRLHPQEIAVVREAFTDLLRTSGETIRLEARVRDRHGRWRTLDAVATNLLDDSAVRGIVINARDVTDRKLAEERLVHDAFHDRLTELPNRALFLDRLGQALRRRRRVPAPPFAILFADLDRFKVVNDSLGHAAGDRLLAEVGHRLARTVRPGDTVARIGVDEYAVLLEGPATERQARAAALRIHRALREPFVLAGKEVFTTASIGIAAVPALAAGDRPSEPPRPEEVLRDAGLAMYRAKVLGRGCHVVFDESMRQAAVAVLELESELRRALERAEMRVHYQPIVALGDDGLAGFEALLRWQHPRHGLLGPDGFLELAEETGLLLPIGWWVIEEACRHVVAWRRASGNEQLFVSVNLSAGQLSQRDLVSRLGELLRSHDVPPGALKLELTESALMRHTDLTDTLEGLKRLRVPLLIDDFGTGYSSLAYLHRFSADTLKIDRSFVGRLGPSGENSEIVRTILALAHELGMSVVAEGVETADHYRQLRDLHCDSAQGWYYAPALPPDEAEAVARRARVG